MPIIITWKPSPARKQAFEAALSHLVQLGRVRAGLNVDPNSYPIYTVDPALVKGDFHLSEIAKLIGWRYYAGDASTEVVLGEVTATSPAVVNRMQYGDPALKAWNAMQALDDRPEFQNDKYQLNILRLPEALTETYWLQPAGSNGLIVPYGKSFRLEHDDEKPENVDDFLHSLKFVETPAKSLDTRA